MVHRYDISHPLLTPERYLSLSKNSIVRSLRIYQDRKKSPDVVLETPVNIKDETFGLMSTRCLHFSSKFHMYISNSQGVLFLGENVLATHLMRLHYSMDYGYIFPDTIYGDVLIFGTGATNYDYSVPYEIVEQLMHLYDKI